MARNYKQPGATLTYENSGAKISADAVVVMAATLGIALVDIEQNEAGSVAVEGVFAVPKAAGTAWTQGQRLDYDAAAKVFTAAGADADGDVVGGAVAAAGAADAATVGFVKLTPGAGEPGSS